MSATMQRTGPALALAALVALAAAACDGMFVEPAPGSPGRVALAFSFNQAAGGNAQAFDQVNAARIRLVRQADGAMVVNESFPLTDTDTGKEASIELELSEDPQVFELTVELSAAGMTVFTGARQVTVRQGQTTDAEIGLQPLVSTVSVSQTDVTLSSIGETVALSAAAMFATGDTVRSLGVQWTSQNGAIATVSANGLVTARAEGQTSVIATVGDISVPVQVRVQATVASVTVSPPSGTLNVGEQLQLAAVARDANGNALVRTTAWSSSNAAVATVDASGRVSAASPGSASIIATVEGKSGSAAITVSAAPAIGISPTSLSFTAIQGGSNPASRTLSISNTGGGTLSWSASDNAGWLTLSPTSGTNSGTVSVSVNIAGLNPGTHNAVVTVTGNASNSPRTVPVTLTITAGPAIGVTPAALSFTAMQGGSNPQSKNLTISNTGGGTLSWTASENDNWLSLNPTSGTNSGTVSVSVDIAGLGIGSHLGYITIAGNATNSPRTVPVHLDIVAGPMIGVSPTSLTFTGVVGAADPPDQYLTISNTGGGTLSWSVSKNAANWLTLSPSSGTDGGTVTVSVSTAGLAEGTYNATITVTGNADNSPRTVPVTLTVTSGAIISVNPTSLSFTGVEGGADPASQTVAISNSGTGTLYPSYSGSSTSWMSLLGVWLPIVPPRLVGVSVSVSTAGLAAGTYSAYVTVTGNASNSPVTVPVTLTVLPAATGIVRGTVMSATGVPLAGAQVTINELSLSAFTNTSGAYQFGAVPAGLYGMTASLIGYLSQSVSDITVSGGQTTTVDFHLPSLPIGPVQWALDNSGTTSTLTMFWGSAANDVHAVGSPILHYSGTNWTTVTSTYQGLWGIWGNAANNVYAVGESGLIRRFNGSSWATMTSGTTWWLDDVWGSSSNNILVVGAAGTILRYDGVSWAPMTSGTSRSLEGVWGSAANNVYAVGSQGTILHFNGTTWTAMTSGTAARLTDVWGSAANDVYAVGDLGTILHFNGTSWTPMTSGTSALLFGIWGSGAGNVYAVGDNGTILYYNGTAWSAQNSGTTQRLLGIWGLSANNIYAGGVGGVIVHGQ